MDGSLWAFTSDILSGPNSVNKLDHGESPGVTNAEFYFIIL